jgi:hypothetical protein
MAFKDIDLTFNKTFSGLGIKEGDDAIIQLVNDAVKTQLGEALDNPNKGSLTVTYAKGTRDSFSVLNIKDEIYFALLNEKEITVARKDISVSLNEKNKKFVVRITVTVLSTNKQIATNIVFNFR